MFTRVAIVNRGEAAMRLIHAVRDLNAQGGGAPIRSIALYTDEERTAMFAREADEAFSLGPASARPYIDLAVLERVLRRVCGGRGLGRLGIRRGGPRVRGPVRAPRRDLHRPERRRDAQARRQDRLQAPRRGGRRAGRAVERGRRRHARGRAGRGRPRRLPAHAQGDRRRRRPGHPPGRRGRRARGRLPAHPRRGRARLRQRRGLPRAPRHRGAARRGPADRRLPRHRVGGRRTRLHDPATQPEGDRGVGVTAARREPDRRAQGVRRAAGARGGLRRRRDGRVPLPPGRADVRLPRGQHPPAGRAPDHRGDDRPRPGQGAAARGGRRSARGDRSRRSAGTPSRRGSTPRTRTATSPRPPAGSRCSTCPPAPASAWTPASARATPSPPTSTR